ncbi:hypothetical protein D3C72_818010 [compost metagenome]
MHLVKRFLAFALTSACIMQVAPTADAVIGDSLQVSMATSRKHKHYLAGATYYVRRGRVVGENWNAEGEWSLRTADKLRLAIVGSKKLKSRFIDGTEPTFVYADGTKVLYSTSSDTTVVGIQVEGPGFTTEDVVLKRVQEVQDWKDRPYAGVRW